MRGFCFALVEAPKRVRSPAEVTLNIIYRYIDRARSLAAARLVMTISSSFYTFESFECAVRPGGVRFRTLNWDAYNKGLQHKGRE